MLRSRAALPHLVIDDSLIPCLTTRGPHGLRIAPDTIIALCAEFAVARHPEPDFTVDMEPDFTVDIRYFRTALESARCLVVPRARPRTRSRWGVRRCTDSGWSLPTWERHHRMTVRRRKWETGFLVGRGQMRAIQRGPSAPPRIPVGVRQKGREQGQRFLHPALASSEGDAPPMTSVGRHHQLECCLTSDYPAASTPPACRSRARSAAVRIPWTALSRICRTRTTVRGCGQGSEKVVQFPIVGRRGVDRLPAAQ